MATKIEVLNEALVLLGQPPAASADDTSTWVKRLNSRYSPTVKKLLEQHSWNFATVVKQLQRLPTASGGREYSYNKPANCLRILFVNNTGDPLDNEWHDYDDADGKIHADYDNIWVWYVSSDYIIKDGSWPQVFASAVAAELAFSCAPVATKDMRRGESLYSIAVAFLKKAKSYDASQKPFRENPRGNWARARRAGSRYNTEGN